MEILARKPRNGCWRRPFGISSARERSFGNNRRICEEASGLALLGGDPKEIRIKIKIRIRVKIKI